ncbi:hypothetical protein NEHOM01_1564 [Nematocida homosporus]|uniref:uncharacterized protein n=1 Tax=Nematocida homosporus TaxID=1912981 RepID=UPI00221FD5F3|nr:uncharacterized protein NEHOM01_1564 [Nematocida homosporus]KAI5186578.1 hypothetical protein NEHOM01_1564 [Nematocida homosporus]
MEHNDLMGEDNTRTTFGFSSIHDYEDQDYPYGLPNYLYTIQNNSNNSTTSTKSKDSIIRLRHVILSLLCSGFHVIAVGTLVGIAYINLTNPNLGNISKNQLGVLPLIYLGVSAALLIVYFSYLITRLIIECKTTKQRVLGVIRFSLPFLVVLTIMITYLISYFATSSIISFQNSVMDIMGYKHAFTISFVIVAILLVTYLVELGRRLFSKNRNTSRSKFVTVLTGLMCLLLIALAVSLATPYILYSNYPNFIQNSH